jgi:hypothetical protein
MLETVMLVNSLLHIGIINVKDFATISFSSTLHGLLAILWNIVLLTINHCEVEQF